MIGMDYDRGLAMLKEYVETGEVSSDLEFKGASDFAGGKYVGIKTDTSIENIGTAMEGDFEKLEAVIEANEDNGSKTFNQDLYRLVKAGKITKESAMANSPNSRQLEMNLKGIFLSSGGIVN